ncbi:glycosyltransferase [Methylobacterium sp. Leaf399]|uniref:glycosyltransferase n=1 Tax=Methylobacterium sp. Leaf399 TaxID=1736364 RepID=UPI0009EC0156|nr:glycosyltransferase [Methylobacterium sp. Leaf399]
MLHALRKIRNKLRISSRQDVPAVAAVDIDCKFYRAYYADLKDLPDDAALIKHYQASGLSEGRFASADAFIASLEDQFGPLPEDFVPGHYKLLHNDLRNLDEPWRLQEHYLRFGQFEERKYGVILHESYDADLKSLRDKHGHAIAGPHLRFADILAAAGMTLGPWLDRFMLYEFTILNAGWLPRVPFSRTDGIQLFLTHGVDRLAPIAMQLRFDPVFYRSQAPASLETLSDADLYRAWLNQGIVDGIACNEGAALVNIIGESTFPPCFDENLYRTIIKNADGHVFSDRFSALVHFFEHGFSRDIAALRGNGIAKLLKQLADYHNIRRNFHIALKACDQALTIDPANSSIHHCRGDVLRNLGQPAESTSAYVLAVTVNASDANIWSHIHAVDGLTSSPNGIGAALDLLVHSAKTCQGSAIWLAAAHRTIARVFDIASADARALYLVGKRREADAHLVACLDLIAKMIEIVDPLPGRRPAPPKGHIVLVANRDLPQCDHYRVVQKCAQLAAGGWEVELFAQDQVHRCRPSLDRAAAVVFYRVPALPGTVHAILYARALGVPTIYDIDDLIFEPSVYPDPFESFEGQISHHDYVSLQYGVPLFRYALQMCDAGIASTPALAEAMRPHLRTGVCHVLRNGLDRRNAPFLDKSWVPYAEDALTIFYGTGTKAHNRDFTELAAPGLLKALATHPRVRLVIAGYLHLDARFAPFANRVRQLGFSSDVAAYWQVLSGADINLAVLAQTPMADAKSEIKWLEAAMCGVPSIVSGTRTYKELLVDGETAVFADTAAEWSRTLERLIKDVALRREIGRRARAKAASEYGLDQAVAVLSEALPAPSSRKRPADGLLPRPETPPPPYRRVPGRKPRILLVNVYFPPQLVGGATRVARNNLDHFLDHAGDRFDFAVAATDTGADPVYGTRIDNYRGVPIYRIAAPRAMHMDWRPLNPEMRAPFDRLLDDFEPDLVHLHCIQQLTGTIVEAVRARAIPYVITLHDAWWISDFQFLVDDDGQVHAPTSDHLTSAMDPAHGPFASLARRRALAGLLDDARSLLAVSDSFADIYRAAGHPRTAVLANGVPSMTRLPRVAGPKGTVRLGHIGGRSTHKGATLIEVVLRAGAFANLHLTIVDHARPTGDVRSEIWGQTPVRIIGQIPQDRVPETYANLDVLLAPSIWPESFGLVTREARAAGLWVVASDRGGIGTGIREGVDGFRIDVGHPDALRDVLARIDADPDRFGRSPPPLEVPERTAADQGDDLLALYATITAA